VSGNDFCLDKSKFKLTLNGFCWGELELVITSRLPIIGLKAEAMQSLARIEWFKVVRSK
jgi:hypothetical protein